MVNQQKILEIQLFKDLVSNGWECLDIGYYEQLCIKDKWKLIFRLGACPENVVFSTIDIKFNKRFIERLVFIETKDLNEFKTFISNLCKLDDEYSIDLNKLLKVL